MEYHKPILLALTCAMCTSVSYAAAFQFYELGTPVNGTAGVGQAAIASDASTAYFNPAGMTALPSSEVMLGSQLIVSNIHFDPNSANTIPGNNGSNAGGLIPGLGGFYVYSYSPQLKFGVSLTSPYGGLLNYNDHWVGRYNVQQMTLLTLNLNPSVAYQINPWLAVGAGLALEYAYLDQTIALPITSFLDGQATLKLDDTSPGFNLGVMLAPYDTTKIGIAYRSQIVHGLSGKVDFLNFSITPSATSKLVTPSNVIASIKQRLNNQFTLLGDLGWTDWSSMHNTIVQVAGYSATSPDNWHDTYRIGLGGQYNFATEPLMLQAGLSYDSSPVSSSNRLPSLPMDRQIRAGVGLEYWMLQSVSLGASYEYINFGNASITNASSVGNLAGKYSSNFANVLQMSLNVMC